MTGKMRFEQSPDGDSSVAGIRGLGVDIVEIDRMRTALARHPAMKERLFSEAERAYCDRRNRPEIHYAMRFAAKEAVLKAIGTGFRGIRFRDVEVRRDGNGRPVPFLHGRAAQVAAERGVVELHLSLSFTHTTAVAAAVAITQAHRPSPKKLPRDPISDLAVAFKKTRSFLDEMDQQGNGENQLTEEGQPAPGVTEGT